MSDDYTNFSTDLDGNGTEDPAAIYTLDDGSNVLVGDLDHDGQMDIAALDSDGDGVYEQAYDPATGTVTDLTDGAGIDSSGTDGGADPDYSAEYDGEGGNLDGDVASGAEPSGGYYDAAAVSDMMAMQHETSMAIINNI
ncbi:hypothetical protein Dvina_09935 [Dactylosporangium vinaceum]|uniref:Uncharacterized protein n=1 Tax=Dactylosporangium vinaceum TaxID=53362 RepID=A0ABV5MB91_9ACTN|nr:hypothetical protein [Dactylosporangium vinaceum]UAB98374.1 hypothetical protein Dvina_09935 [Dactylosporangium vinaceum]